MQMPVMHFNSREELVDILVESNLIDSIKFDIHNQKTFADKGEPIYTVFCLWLDYCLFSVEKGLDIEYDPWTLASKMKIEFEKKGEKIKIWRFPNSPEPTLGDVCYGIKLKEERYQKVKDLEDEILTNSKGRGD